MDYKWKIEWWRYVVNGFSFEEKWLSGYSWAEECVKEEEDDGQEKCEWLSGYSWAEECQLDKDSENHVFLSGYRWSDAC